MTEVAAPAITTGDHIVDDELLERAFIAALETYPTGTVLVERWQELVRDPATKGLEFVWRWHLQVIGKMHGYEPRELLLDLAVPLRPGTGDASNPTILAARGAAASLLGIGARDAPAPAAEEEENKVLELPLPVAPPAPPPPSHLDPNLFPG
jgi:hypothetical protein